MLHSRDYYEEWMTVSVSIWLTFLNSFLKEIEESVNITYKKKSN